MNNSIEDRVVQIISEQLGIPRHEVALESSFVADLGADSLDLVELAMSMEDEFALEIPDDDAEKLTTVRDALAYLHQRQRAPWSAETSKVQQSVPVRYVPPDVRFGPSELEMHRMDYRACKAAGFESPGELLSAYRTLESKYQSALRQLEQAGITPV